MISHNLPRTKKSHSAVYPKEDKENCSNNIQLQAKLGMNKLVKLRESLDYCNQPEKIISSLSISTGQDDQPCTEDLKKEYTRLIKQDYSRDILEALIGRSCETEEALKNHSITPQLRAKMVDWMIEVLSSYKMSEETFFRSVKYMDLFFKKTTRKLQVAQLHLLGVASMFTAAKNEEIYPFKLNTMYDKICRKKFTKREIIDIEEQMLMLLDFQMQKTTCYDIIQLVLNQMDIPLPVKATAYLAKVSLYLGKMALHCCELAWKTDQKLAAAVIYIALKTVEQVEPNLESDSYLEEIAERVQVKVSEVLEVSQELLSAAKTFHKQYPSLTNLKKFNNAQFSQ